MSPDLVNSISVVLQVVIALTGAFLLAFWVSLVIWTFRDIRARSHDFLAAILASLLVLLLGPIGLLLYILLRPKETLAEAYDRALEEEALLREIEEQYVCPQCNRKSQADWQFCPYCHTSLRYLCQSCERLLEMDWELCPYCGHDHRTEETKTPQVQTDGYTTGERPGIRRREIQRPTRPRRESLSESASSE